MSAAAALRPRVSAEFLRRNTCERIVTGTAKVIAEHGYQAATVSDIVKACGVARNTFYGCFGGKEEAALALVGALEVEIEELSEAHSLDVLLIEGAAMHHAGEVDRASNYLVACEQIVRFFGEADLSPPPPSGDPRQGTLPPGRHGLSREFIAENQRARLLSGTAAAIADRGFPAVRISDVTTQAALSRRTFYEQFSSVADVAQGMVATTLPTALLDDLLPDSGLFAVAVEILAERLVGADPLERRPSFATKSLSAVYALTVALEAK